MKDKAHKGSPSLRSQAEQRMESGPYDCHGQEGRDPRALNHELQVYRIELDMQNDELRHSRDEMAEAQQKYHDIYEFAPVGYMTLDENGRILELNLMAARLLGRERSLVVAHPFAQFFSPEYRMEFGLFLRRVLSESGQVRCEMKLLDDLTTRKWVRVDGVAALNVDGLSRECRVVLSDITDRRQAEEQLMESETRMRVALEAGDLGSWDLDSDTGDMFRSLRHDQIFGYRDLQPEWSLDIMLRHVVPEDRPVVREACARAGELGVISLEVRVRQPDESIRWIFMRGRTSFDSAGRAVRVIGIIADITEKKQIDLERETTLEFLHLMSESSNTRAAIEAAVSFFQLQSGCEAVGVRLHSGDDYPYFVVSGFQQEFVQAENSLCPQDPAGDIVRDSDGNPLLECLCGAVIRGRFNPALPLFTSQGSFWTNSTTKLLEGSIDADLSGRTRDRCIAEGYESMALIPLRLGEDQLGLLQLDDRRPGLFTQEGIRLWEKLCSYLTMTISKLNAKEESRRYIEELRTINEELAGFNTAAVGRELRMIELKQEINRLCEQSGLPSRYLLGGEAEAS